MQDVHPCSVCSYSTRVVLVLLYPPPRRQSPKDEKQENVQLGFTQLRIPPKALNVLEENSDLSLDLTQFSTHF